LHKGAGQLLLLPGRARLAGAQAHGYVLHPDRLPGLQGEIAHDPVALVEQAEDRDPLGHRSHAGQVACRARDIDRNRLIALKFIALPGPIAARGNERQRQDEESAGRLHAWSGFHAS